MKEKKVVVGSDAAGFPLKEAVVAHLKEQGWEIEDVGVTCDENRRDPENMFHRVGFRVGAKVSEGEYERGLVFCGTGQGIHIAAGKCPHVQAAVVESVPSGLRAACGNGAIVLGMGAFYVAPIMGCEIADAFLNHELGDGFDYIANFKEYHQLAKDEIEAFNYEEFKANGFKVKHLGDVKLGVK